MQSGRVHKIITLGPATNNIDLRRLKAKGVDFVRNNMSHSSLEEFVKYLSCRILRDSQVVGYVLNLG